MHGIIFLELRKFAESQLGAEGWTRLVSEAGTGRVAHLAFEAYPDEELVALVGAASTLSGVPIPALLEAFGDFIAEDLVHTYASLIRPQWRTLDLLEHTEDIIHTTIRRRDPKADPPALHCQRRSPREVQISYNSPRKLCYVAKGLIRGIARHYGETVTVEESSCMHRGAPSCELRVAVTG